jgi:glutathione S-transferase
LNATILTFLKINPSGAMPDFRSVDGRGLTQASAIVKYISPGEGRGNLLGEDDPLLRDQVAMRLVHCFRGLRSCILAHFVPLMCISGWHKQTYPTVKEAGIQLARGGLSKIDTRLEGRTMVVEPSKTAVDSSSVPVLRRTNYIVVVEFAGFTNVANDRGGLTMDNGVFAAMHGQGTTPCPSLRPVIIARPIPLLLWATLQRLSKSPSNIGRKWRSIWKMPLPFFPDLRAFGQRHDPSPHRRPLPRW